MRRRYALLLLVLLPMALRAQKMDTTVTGNLTLIQEQSVYKLMNARVVTLKPKTMPGFRVQIASTPNRNEAMDMKTNFLKQHPDMRAYINYQQPYFKLRVGDFEQRTDAAKFMNDIYQAFPGFIVNDIINTSNEPENLESKNNR